MLIAVIGTGNVGRALGLGWTRAGHSVIFGARDPKDSGTANLLQQGGNKVRLTSVVDSVVESDVVALAVPWSAVPDLLPSIRSALAEKILIDCTNPAKQWPVMDHAAGSGGEQIARLVPNAKVVKAFNTTGFENMQDPRYEEGAVTMFYAGDDVEAKTVVHGLAQDLGFDPIDAGGLAQSHSLEILASLWGSLAYGQKMGRGIGFRLMRRTS